MQGMVRRIRALTALVVVAGVLTSAWATCAEEATATATEQMACCKAGHDHCPMHDSAADCCKENSSFPQPQWSVVAKAADSLNAPVRLFLAVVTPATPLSDAALLVQPVRAAAPSPPLRPTGPPVYIAFSTLLI
jgi:hypothetical protein